MVSALETLKNPHKYVCTCYYLPNNCVGPNKRVGSKKHLKSTHLNQGGGQIMPTLYCCPHQVLKATGAPGKSFDNS